MDMIPKKRWIQFFACWCIMGILFVLIITGTVRIVCHGVCVDSYGNIYVGLESEIRVFDGEGNLIGKISPQTSKGYSFTIEEDQLLLNTDGNAYILSRTGAVIQEKQDQTFLISHIPVRTISVQGTVYHITSYSFFYRVVVEHGTEKRVVVQMPIMDIFAEIAFLGVCVLFGILLIRTLDECRKHRLQRKGQAENGKK